MDAVPPPITQHLTKYGGSKYHGNGDVIFPIPIPTAIFYSNAEVLIPRFIAKWPILSNAFFLFECQNV